MGGNGWRVVGWGVWLESYVIVVGELYIYMWLESRVSVVGELWVCGWRSV